MRAAPLLLALVALPALAACAGDPITTRDPNPGPPRGYRLDCETYPFLDPLPLLGELTANYDATCAPNTRERRRAVIRSKG